MIFPFSSPDSGPSYVTLNIEYEIADIFVAFRNIFFIPQNASDAF